MRLIINNAFKFNEEALEGDIDRFIEVPENHDELVRKSELYRNVNYPVVVASLPDGGWLAEHPDLPGCKIHGKTPEEAKARLEEVKLTWIYAALADGRQIPKPQPDVPLAKTN
ncbi:MAG: hypothetical protein A4E53_00382 [Pelotomaculum sp. PtaB.Bin104]|nr:MAG: hypothetical protein A4E53_00382 [Pelotomaculum sp. PtaB.Bin104]